MFVNQLLGRAVLGLTLTLWLAGCGDDGDDPRPRVSCEELSSRLQDALTQAVSEKALVGATASVRLPDCTWSGAAGASRMEPAVAMVPGDRLRVGSITKTFISVVALQLQAEGRLSLDTPLATWLPDFPRADRITVRQLLNHTSGAANYTDHPGFLERAMAEPGREWTVEELILLGAEHSPLFEPGAGWTYSNTNYILASVVIEKVTGTPFARQVRERILEPLELRSTGMDGSEALPPLTVRGLAHEDGAWVDLTELLHPSAIGAAGALISSAEDISRFYLALFEGSLLSPAQRAELTRWVPAEPGGAPAYGLGLLLGTSPLGPLHGHEGGVPGYSALAGYYPDHKAAVSVLTNHDDGDPSAVTLSLLEVLARR
ncbi:serine hydrolase domain-containing protein [Pyxidicoccus trucidator]|uniref:serine hydrolase domain-containing protein n=1 Tax=Pyxidicoccus trucidator TaxID=2709662 RepID=UPI0013D93C52|nr:serine hydrolase domain-containing protein [Pyxidicoccus trucidator]